MVNLQLQLCVRKVSRQGKLIGATFVLLFELGDLNKGYR